MPIATGIAYFADESAGMPDGGELAYWPDGADGDAGRAADPPQHGHRARHRLGLPRRRPGRAGRHAEPFALRPGNVLELRRRPRGCCGPRPGQRRRARRRSGGTRSASRCRGRPTASPTRPSATPGAPTPTTSTLDVILAELVTDLRAPRRPHRRRAVRARPRPAADRHLRALPRADPADRPCARPGQAVARIEPQVAAGDVDADDLDAAGAQPRRCGPGSDESAVQT